MSLWFGVSASAPRIQEEWGLESSELSGLTLAVQFGFVAGTFMVASLSLADVIRSRTLVASATLLGALANGLLALTAGSLGPALILRFLTGVALAGVYPPAMKMLAGWFVRQRGLALGTLIGALTCGKAAPYVINAIGSDRWRVNVLAMSALALAGALLVLLVREGPFVRPSSPFDLRQVSEVFRNRGVRLANLGYFGHMWELYAMWTWIPVMLRASVGESSSTTSIAEIGSFLVIGSGALGCVLAGHFADRIGRTVVTSASMIVSGSCCILVGFVFHSPVLLLVVATVWGATVVADSAQFSACVTEVGNQDYLGTALTLQTCIGFLLTTISIEMIPRLVDIVGWEWAFIALAPGPVAGTIAMLRLRALPEALKIAQGRR
jgi:MFS family permease